MDREIRLHSELQHENIVALYAAFEDRDHVYLLQEHASGARCAVLLGDAPETERALHQPGVELARACSSGD